jgi:protein-S-isoprenylcysteine O-methyltransferase Ste14
VPAGRAVAALTGLALAALGWAVILWAVRSFPGVSPGHYVLPEQRIVSDGAYGLVRHPLYLGALLIWCALALAFWSPVTLAVTVLYVVPAYWSYVRSEERMLLSHFGDEYARYRARVGMLFPRPGADVDRRPSGSTVE